MFDPHIKYAHVLDRAPRHEPLDEAGLRKVLEAETLGWVHIDGTQPGAEDWITRHLDYLDPQAIEALLDKASRPRLTPLGEGLMLILREINSGAGEDPEDMVSLRLWIDAHRIVTVALRPIGAFERLDAALGAGRGPQTAGEFLVALVEDVVRRIAEFQADLDAQAEALEMQIVGEEDGGDHLRGQVADLRLQVIAAKRFLAPQREAITGVAAAKAPFIDTETRREIEEEAQKMTRIVEDLDELRDQATVLREELSGQLSDRLNRNMFAMSVASVIFLPLGFLTGLFGVNVAGMPGMHSPWAFTILTASLGALTAVLLLLLWRLRWIGRAPKPHR